MNNELAAIRAKKIGVLLRQMRESHGHTEEKCANWLGISPAAYKAIESGENCASLPQIESLSYLLGFPFEFFTTVSPATEQVEKNLSQQVNQELVKVRNKMIAILLRQKREQKEISLGDMAKKVDLPENELQVYEEESASIPFSNLVAILEVLEISLDKLFSQDGPFKHESSSPVNAGGAIHSDLPEEVIEFVSKPANMPYIELAMRFSKMDANKIRTIASSLLEITY